MHCQVDGSQFIGAAMHQYISFSHTMCQLAEDQNQQNQGACYKNNAYLDG